MKNTLSWKAGNVSLVALCVALGLAGCAAISSSVPSDVMQSSSPVRLQSGTFQSFVDGSMDAGEYRVTRIRYGTARSDGLQLGPFTQERTSSSFTFLISSPRTTWRAACSRGARTQGITNNRSKLEFEKSDLRCELLGGAQRVTMELTGLDGSKIGSIQVGDETFSMRQYFADNVPVGRAYIPGPLGMRIDRKSGNAGALELAGLGTFWINRTLSTDTQDALAGVLTAMLIEHRRYAG